MNETTQGSAEGDCARLLTTEERLAAATEDCDMLRQKLTEAERGLGEWQKLRRENAVAEQQAASLTHELLREKAKTEQLRVDLLQSQDDRNLSVTKRLTVAVVVFLVGIAIGHFLL